MDLVVFSTTQQSQKHKESVNHKKRELKTKLFQFLERNCGFYPISM